MAERDFRPDTVIYATGYRQTFEFLEKDYAIPGEMEMRNITSKNDPTVAFIGFVRPGLGTCTTALIAIALIHVLHRSNPTSC
jgi:dimethylaniline monooxygenase (N-oxide forming)